MLVLGIILTILGFIIFQWSANALSKSFIERPLIFANPKAVLVIHLLWIGLIIGGLILLWRVNPIIVLAILGIYAVLWVWSYFLGSEKTRAKKIFKIYKQLKLFYPQVKEEETLKEVTRLYFQNLRWDEDRINMTLEIIFNKKEGRTPSDVKDLVSSIFIFENPRFELESYTSYIKQSAKREKAIEQAYKAVFEEKTKIIERPILSEATLQRMKQIGLNPDEMSNEQLVAIESLENPEKSHWISKVFTYISYGLFILAIISLFTLEWRYFLFYLITALILGYIGYRIQSRVAGRQFIEASIRKFARNKTLEKEEILYCHNCGAKIKKETKFCSQCGEKI